jgi:biotin operon repressor
MITWNYHKITIINTRRPAKQSLNQKLQWLANSLGLLNMRDKDNSAFRIFIELLKASKTNSTMSSDELGDALGLSRGTIVHHLSKLIDAGLIVVERNRYYLRMNNLSSLVEEVEKDVERTLEGLKSAAKEIDGQLGL